MMEGRILGTPPDRPSIILQSGAFVNIQNAQMMGQKFFLSNNTVWGDAVMGLDVVFGGKETWIREKDS